MTLAAPGSNTSFPHRHLLGIEGLSPAEIVTLLDLSETRRPARPHAHQSLL
jgi:aspartate carbamoyltransferase catalytic subunit